MQASPAKVELRMASGASSGAESVRAAEAACDACLQGLDTSGSGRGRVDVAFVFISPQHVAKAAEIASAVLRRLEPGALIGVSGIGVCAGPHELERTPAVSILAARLPGVTAHAFTSEDLPAVDDEPETLARLAEAMGVGEDHRFTLFLADPFSVPLIRLLPAMNRCRPAASPGRTQGLLFGGMASASTQAGGNALLLGDRVLRSGAVGLTLRGRLRVDTVVSQGCRPFGPPMVVTKAKGNLIFELGGRPVIDAIQEAVTSLGEGARATLAGGLYVGRVINEYKGRFGRDDYLIRNVVNVDPERGAIAVADLVRIGQTVRMHARDAVTAKEDLALLLDAQKLYDRPRGALLVTCNGRGKRMFGHSHHDAGAVVRAFATPQGGEELSKPGTPIEPPGDDRLPLAGFFANGEIGPVGGESFQHGHTACVALFREE